jgi:hypothetical protein
LMDWRCVVMPPGCPLLARQTRPMPPAGDKRPGSLPAASPVTDARRRRQGCAAERRDRAADERPSEDAEAQSRVDRMWAGRDRDASMIDRADLIKELGDRETHSRRNAPAVPCGSPDTGGSAATRPGTRARWSFTAGTAAADT